MTFSAAEQLNDFWSTGFSKVIIKSIMFSHHSTYSKLKHNILPACLCRVVWKIEQTNEIVVTY